MSEESDWEEPREDAPLLPLHHQPPSRPRQGQQGDRSTVPVTMPAGGWAWLHPFAVQNIFLLLSPTPPAPPSDMAAFRAGSRGTRMLAERAFFRNTPLLLGLLERSDVIVPHRWVAALAPPSSGRKVIALAVAGDTVFSLHDAERLYSFPHLLDRLKNSEIHVWRAPAWERAASIVLEGLEATSLAVLGTHLVASGVSGFNAWDARTLQKEHSWRNNDDRALSGSQFTHGAPEQLRGTGAMTMTRSGLFLWGATDGRVGMSPSGFILAWDTAARPSGEWQHEATTQCIQVRKRHGATMQMCSAFRPAQGERVDALLLTGLVSLLAYEVQWDGVPTKEESSTQLKEEGKERLTTSTSPSSRREQVISVHHHGVLFWDPETWKCLKYMMTGVHQLQPHPMPTEGDTVSAIVLPAPAAASGVGLLSSSTLLLARLQEGSTWMTYNVDVLVLNMSTWEHERTAEGVGSAWCRFPPYAPGEHYVLVLHGDTLLAGHGRGINAFNTRTWCCEGRVEVPSNSLVEAGALQASLHGPQCVSALAVCGTLIVSGTTLGELNLFASDNWWDMVRSLRRPQGEVAEEGGGVPADAGRWHPGSGTHIPTHLAYRARGLGPKCRRLWDCVRGLINRGPDLNDIDYDSSARMLSSMLRIILVFLIRVWVLCYYIPTRMGCTIQVIIIQILFSTSRGGTRPLLTLDGTMVLWNVLYNCWFLLWLASLGFASSWHEASRWKVFSGRPVRFERLQRCVAGIVLATLLLVLSSLSFDVARMIMGRQVFCNLSGTRYG